MIGPEETNAGMLLAWSIVGLWLALVVWLTAMALLKVTDE